MKAVVIGEPSGTTMEVIMAVYPRHKLVVNKYIERGDVIGIGPFADLGNMAIFRTHVQYGGNHNMRAIRDCLLPNNRTIHVIATR